MLQVNVVYQCKLCNHQSFYIIPADEKTKSNDLVSSNTKFLVKCKKCKQKYILKVSLKVV